MFYQSICQHIIYIRFTYALIMFTEITTCQDNIFPYGMVIITPIQIFYINVIKLNPQLLLEIKQK